MEPWLLFVSITSYQIIQSLFSSSVCHLCRVLGEILLLSTVQKLLEFKIVSDKHVQKLVWAEIVALLNYALWDRAEGFADSLNEIH